MPTKKFGEAYDAASTPLDGTETLSIVQGGVMVDCTTQDIADLGGGGSGDVVGPASATDNALVRFDGTTGKLIQNSPVLVTDSGAISAYLADINLQTGTTYTVLSSDAGKVIDHSNAGAITVTLPNNMPVGWSCTYIQSGAGQVTFSAASGATLRNRQSHSKIAGQWGEVVLIVRANSGGSAADYVLGGDTAA